jgi:hypothetical protein
MTYWEETIPADANPGPLVYTALATKLLALGWTLEDTVIIGARTHKVLKSAAAGNTYGLDWFLDISYPTTGIATGLLLVPFEGFNTSTDVATRGPYSASSAVAPDATTFSRFGATASALETNWANTGGHTSLTTPLSLSAFVIHASVTRDRVILLSSTEGAEVSYCGFFTPTTAHASHAGAALFPLITARLLGSSDRASSATPASATAALTRLPKLSSLASWGSHCVVGPNTMRLNGRVGGAASEADNQITAVAFLVGAGGGAWIVGDTTSQVGELDGVRCAYANSAVTRGDTVTVDGVTHTLSTQTGSAAILIEQV